MFLSCRRTRSAPLAPWHARRCSQTPSARGWRRRRERMRERGAFEHGKAPYPPATTQPAATAAAAGATGAAASASAASAAVRAGGRTFSNELSQIRAEQQSRVSKLFAQLDRLAAYKGGAAHNKADDARPLPRRRPSPPTARPPSCLTRASACSTTTRRRSFSTCSAAPTRESGSRSGCSSRVASRRCAR